MNLLKIVLYSVSKKDFFDLLYNINCDAREYIGCTNVDRYFDIERVEREELIDIGLGVKISRPIIVEGVSKGGDYMFSSLSHNGVLAINHYQYGHKVQLTDFVKGKQIKIEVEGTTQTGFFDESMVMLSYKKILGVCSVEEIFSEKNVSVLKRIGDVIVYPFTDVSLLHSTRVLVFISMLYFPCEFNVDTGIIRQLDTGKKALTFASLTGIDVGVKGVFMEDENNYFTFSLNNNNRTSLVSANDLGWGISTFIPSSSDPEDISKGMKIYEDGCFIRETTEKRRLTTPFQYQCCQSMVRLFQDIFLVYDKNTINWYLVKIVVP